MAERVMGSESRPNAPEQGYFVPGAKLKRRISYYDDVTEYDLDGAHELGKRAKVEEDWGCIVERHYDQPRHNLRWRSPPPHHHAHGPHPHHQHLVETYHHRSLRQWRASLEPDIGRPASPTPVHRDQNLAFFVLREGNPTQEPCSGYPSPSSTSACAMERTQSGVSISSDASDLQDCQPSCSDHDAAELVRAHVASYRHNTQSERILKSLINPRARGYEFPLDNDALRSIFSAANELFFANRLVRRVAWDWSHKSSSQYSHHVVGTTALRRSVELGGYETLIVLSSPILKDTKYNRRLLISTFLHEMIHSFLFITCGLKAREDGGHTPGFHKIAQIIDNWVGKEYLRLSDMEADLEHFHVRGHCQEQTRSQRPGTNNDEYVAPRARNRFVRHEEWQWHNQEGFRTSSTATSPSR
ncbi:unnamed protein product [Clonostachys solani]|uniref:SprT-like domain-containing protein n=1 Tax=Clonostachys solani TaxID=160281 RepID=A0A9N9ZJZ8_9HYPO|nr:unnamed protein product [Clonostachys solani]